ncbi:MAG: ferredoxin-thioredoxin reductase catalytic domain-containing protein [Candidatus Bathyarchaeota archaeon]
MTTLDEVKRRAEQDAKSRGMYLTPDEGLLKNLLEGLKENEDRYGYHSCPCRIASGVFDLDRDIICPCDYRDPDVAEYGTCYCCLYVDQEAHEGKKEAKPIPERRPLDKQMRGLGMEEPESKETTPKGSINATDRILFYCKQCGYVVFRNEPPYVCPICRAKREMFQEIVTTQGYYTRKLT